MANLVVTSTSNCIVVVTNDLEEKTGMKQGVWQKKDISFAQCGPFINVSVLGSPSFLVSYGLVEGGLQIDSVNATSPTTLDHLFTLLCGLIA